MGRKNEPWFRASKNAWYVNLDGKQVRLAATKREAFEKFYELKSSEQDSQELLAVLMDEFLTWTQKYRSDGTYRFYKEHCAELIEFLKSKRKFEIKIPELSPDLFEKHIESLPVGRRNGSVQMIKRVYNWALKRGRIISNPIAAVEKPASGVRKNIVPDDAYELIKKHSSKCFSDFITFLWETGCRPQEAWRLKPEFVDDEYKRCILPKEFTKRKKGDRIIYCNDIAWEVVLQNQTNKGFLFVNNNGTQWTKDSVGARMYALKTNIGKRFAPYDFRHTWITKKVKAGLDIHLIAKLAGTSIAMIERHYDQSDEDAEYMSSLVN